MSPRPHTILVVDDCQMNRHLFKATLLGAGYAVDECSSGEACLTYCDTKPLPALMILDIVMPGIDGFQVLTRLRARYSPDQLPIIVVSSCAEGADVVRGLTSGANDYVAKPIERSTFLARVFNHVTLSQMRRTLDEHRQTLDRVLEVQRAIGDVMDEGLIVHRKDGSVLYGNDPMRALCNGNPADTIFEVLKRIFPEPVLSDVSRMWWSADSSGTGDFEHEVQLPTPFRKSIVVRSRRIRIAGEEALRLWSFRDVTDVRELERRMQVQVQLESVGKFVHGAAHNFNNILSGVLGSANLLRRWNSDNPQAMACITMIERCVGAGARFTDKLTTMVKGQRLLESNSNEDLGEVLRVLTEAAQLNIGERISFVLETDAELPPVPFNIRNLADIFGNVLSNAVDSIPDTGVIRIVARKNIDDDLVNVSFEDSGRGMDGDTARRVYEPFFSTKSMDMRHGLSCEGRGLGMWNVYNLVRSFGGNVLVSSRPGEGTNVMVELPVKEGTKDGKTSGASSKGLTSVTLS